MDENTGKTIYELKRVWYLPGPRHTDNCNINMTAFIFNLQIMHAKMVWMYYKRMSRKPWWRRNMDGMMTSYHGASVLLHRWTPPPPPQKSQLRYFLYLKPEQAVQQYFAIFETPFWRLYYVVWKYRLLWASDQVRHPALQERGMG